MNFSIKVPATSANLGPGFDTLGLALDMWNETSITSAEEFSVKVSGEGAGRLSGGKYNLIVRAAQRLADHVGTPLPPFYAECRNQIPLSSGMGSSSAAILTGLLGGNALLENPLAKEEILNLAAEMEGHSDNVAPALMGGLVVSTIENGRVVVHQIPISIDIHLTIALPDLHISTKEARAALPKSVPMNDAVHNLSRIVLVTEAFRTGDMELLGKAMTDKLHEPYRLRLIPGARSAMEAAKGAGAAAVALSGAGPSLIAFSSKADAKISQGDDIGESMKRAFKEAGLETRVFRLGVSSQGAEIQIL